MKSAGHGLGAKPVEGREGTTRHQRWISEFSWLDQARHADCIWETQSKDPNCIKSKMRKSEKRGKQLEIKCSVCWSIQHRSGVYKES